MLLEGILWLVTFQGGILFNKSGRKIGISHCTAEVNERFEWIAM